MNDLKIIKRIWIAVAFLAPLTFIVIALDISARTPLQKQIDAVRVFDTAIAVQADRFREWPSVDNQLELRRLMLMREEAARRIGNSD
jgi:hypothetical protein